MHLSARIHAAEHRASPQRLRGPAGGLCRHPPRLGRNRREPAQAIARVDALAVHPGEAAIQLVGAAVASRAPRTQMTWPQSSPTADGEAGSSTVDPYIARTE